MTESTHDWPNPWPISALIARLRTGTALHDLTRSKQATRSHDVREVALEDIARETMAERFGTDSVLVRRRIGQVLRVGSASFPATSIPDLTIRDGDRSHICELKSSRADYDRFDCVLGGRARDHFVALGHTGPNPWEVEQDLVKLYLYKQLSNSVGSCLFLMVDAFEGSGRCWTRAFADRDVFRQTMRTEFVRDLADTFVDASRIEEIRSGSAVARIISCVIHDM